MTNLSREARAFDRWLTTEPGFGSDGCPCGGDHAAEDHEREAALDDDADAYFDSED